MASRLEELGNEFRKQNIVKNTYQNAQGNEYGAKHPNAKADGDSKGKGTGNFLDTYNGGSIQDELGSAEEPGSGRIAKMAKNKYSAEKPYQLPETDDNNNQFRVR